MVHMHNKDTRPKPLASRPSLAENYEKGVYVCDAVGR